MRSKEHIHYHRKKSIHWIRENKKWILVSLFFIFLFLLVILFDNRKPNETDIDKNEIDFIETFDAKYDAIITVIDGETEENFTKIWGSIISNGYPICSNLVIDSIEKDNYLNWETIEALNNVGVEFLFHPYNHKGFNGFSYDEIEYYFENGIELMNQHSIKQRFIVWTSEISDEIYNIGKSYFDAGFAYANGVDTVYGEKGDKIKIQYRYNASNYSYQDLIALINTAIENNGWVVLFTRNNNMNQDQINIYHQAFEYAKQHNVAVVTASEGFDLYYGNKLGNNNH